MGNDPKEVKEEENFGVIMKDRGSFMEKSSKAEQVDYEVIGNEQDLIVIYHFRKMDLEHSPLLDY